MTLMDRAPQKGLRSFQVGTDRFDFFPVRNEVLSREKSDNNDGKSHPKSTVTITRPREDDHQLANEPMDSDCEENETGGETGTDDDDEKEDEDADTRIYQVLSIVNRINQNWLHFQLYRLEDKQEDSKALGLKNGLG